ncbi:MAG: hypothetical protein KDI53_05650 [Candidatus Accumulibacter sp.]|nr:hypothetical protein [Accumulibacter sp.]
MTERDLYANAHRAALEHRRPRLLLAWHGDQQPGAARACASLRVDGGPGEKFMIPDHVPSGLTYGLDFLVRADWTPAQTYAVAKLVDRPSNRIWNRYELTRFDFLYAHRVGDLLKARILKKASTELTRRPLCFDGRSSKSASREMYVFSRNERRANSLLPSTMLTLWPPLLRLTASSLNSIVYACLGIFVSHLPRATSILGHPCRRNSGKA